MKPFAGFLTISLQVVSSLLSCTSDPGKSSTGLPNETDGNYVLLDSDSRVTTVYTVESSAGKMCLDRIIYMGYRQKTMTV